MRPEAPRKPPDPTPARRRSPAPRWRALPLRRSRTEVGPFRVHAVEMGSGDSCVVLLHGLAGSARWWHRNVEALAASHRVIAPDMIGFGRSRTRSRLLPDVPGVADVVAAWLEARGVRRAHVVGHSMGGQLAVHLAARHPDRVDRLVLVSPAGIPRPITPSGALRFAREIAPPHRWGDPAFLPVIVGDAFRAGAFVILRAITHIVRDDVRPLLARVQAPTLVLWGEHDRLTPLEDAEVFRRGIPGARLAVVGGAAHNCMVDRADDFNRMVLAFLRGEEVGA